MKSGWNKLLVVVAVMSMAGGAFGEWEDGKQTWRADTLYTIKEGGVFVVPSGCTLTIEPGTEVRFSPYAELVVAAGATCIANGVKFTHGDAESPFYSVTGALVTNNTTEWPDNASRYDSAIEAVPIEEGVAFGDTQWANQAPDGTGVMLWLEDGGVWDYCFKSRGSWHCPGIHVYILHVSDILLSGDVSSISGPGGEAAVESTPGVHTRYVISFSPNGGEGSMAEIGGGEGAIVSLPPNRFEREGHHFGGWARSADGVAEYEDGAEIALDGDLTLHATWIRDEGPTNFKIEDVSSAVCRGRYGKKDGKKATFLSGTYGETEFTATVSNGDGEVEVTGLLVNGKEVAWPTFRFDPGKLKAGTPMNVRAVGRWHGEVVKSDLFRVNVDVASSPRIFGMTDVEFRYVAGRKYAQVGRTKFQIGEDGPRTAASPWWLPKGMTWFAPLIAMKAEFSQANGTITYSPALFEMTGEHDIPSRKRNGKFGEMAGIGFGFGVNGTMVIRWNPESLEWEDEGVGLSGEVSGGTDWTWPFVLPTPIGPIPLFAEVGVEAELAVALTYHGMGAGDGLETESNWEWSAESEQFPTISGALGVGVNHFADVKGGIKASGVYQGSIGGLDGESLAFGVKGTIFGTVEVLAWESTISLDTDTYWFLGGGETGGGGGGGGGWTRRGAEMVWVPMGRAYLRREADGARKEREAKANGFDTGGYPSPRPTVAVGGGAVRMAYLRDDGTRGDADRTEVVVQEGIGGAWAGVEKPWDDGTADWMPSLAVAGEGTAVLAWANAKQAWGTATPEFGEMTKGLELAVAVRDAGTGAWSARNLTDDGATDFSPVVCAAEDGTAMVAWLRNESGTLFGSAGSPTDVMASRWNGSEWSVPVVVAEGVGTVSGLDLAYDGTNGGVVWAFDGDGDWSTGGDAAIGAAVWTGGEWRAATVLAEGLDGVSPVVARIDGRGSPSPRGLWVVDGVLWERAADGSGAAVASPMAWVGDIPGTARAVHGAGGALGVAWEDEGRPVVMEYDPEMGLWGGPVALGEGEAGRMTKSVSASIGNGGISAAWESVAVATNAEGEVEFGGTELRMASMAAGTANPGVVADGFVFATNEVVAGELTGVRVMVRNSGMEGASNVALRVWVCDGELEEDEEARWELRGKDSEPVVLDLPGGAEVAATVWWMAEDWWTNLTFVARVEVPEGGGDADADDNEAVWRPGLPALRLENARCEAVGAGIRLLTATVGNGGLAAAEAGTVVSFRLGAPGGEEVGRDVAGAVPAGEGHGYDAGVAWDMSDGNWTGAWVTVYAVMDTGNEEEDASWAVPIRVMTPLDRDGDGLLDGEELAMKTNPLKEDTNGDGVSDYDHVYVWFTDPLAGMGAQWTTNTPMKVPFTWLERWPEALAAHGGDYEEFAADTAANGRPVWECYVAGLDPTDKEDELRVTLVQDEDGRWVPQILSGRTEERTYEFEGAERLPVEGEESLWGELEEGSRFFRVRVAVE